MTDALDASAGSRLRPSRLLAPLVPAYAAALALKDVAYTRGWLTQRRLQSPVISVGGLSVGGSGKTPLVISLARLLATHGLAVDVLSRGYGRRSVRTEQVHLGDLGGAVRYGDEPLLIAQAAGVPVYVGSSRHAAGLLAEQQPTTSDMRVHLLDDGFQHRQLARAADIVVLHRSDYGEWLLPAGRLREPLAALHRATAAVLRAEDADLQPMLRRRGFHLPVWFVSRSLAVPPLAVGRRALAFCGIARPQEFFAALRGSGVSLAAAHGFPDHHAFREADLARIVASARATRATLLLTTEKDLVRLRPESLQALQGVAPLYAVPLQVRFQDEVPVLTTLLRLMEAHRQPGPSAHG